MLRRSSPTPDRLVLEQVYERAARYCATAERCVTQVRHKLRLWGLSEAYDIETIILRLQAAGFCDDARFARAYARDKRRFSGWGTHRIARELRARAIKVDTITHILQELEEEEPSSNKLYDLLERKLRILSPSLDHRKIYERLVRFGIYQGYSYEDVVCMVQILLRKLEP